MSDQCGRTQPTEGGANPGQEVLGCFKKETERAEDSKPIISISSQSLLQVLP